MTSTATVNKLARLFASGLTLALALTGWGCGKTAGIRYENGAVPPAEAAATYRVAEGFKIELIASEPLIGDPVDMEIDEYGNCYVVEMPGYPLDMTHTGRVKLLRDTDGDGVMDESVLFADNLMFPNGVLRWKKGVIITDAPQVLYLEDSDGDGRADIRDTLLTGFSLSNPHVNVNNPVYGLDNWIYLAHFGHINTRKYEDMFGDLGEEIRFADQAAGPRLPRNADSRSVRFKPGERLLEKCSSKSQFGHTFDPWGRHFLTHNQNHIYQEVIRAPYLERNPELLVSDATEPVSDHGNATEVFQITTNPDRQLFTPAGVTTSTSGITVYTGGGFPPPFGDSVAFVAESVSNLVHVDILKEHGATFTAARNRPDREFLASTDFWARPVNMYVGPDGALYVLDYYRRIIEHPEWMSDEAVKAGGLYDGAGMGRIYRISPVDFPEADWTKGLELGNAESTELVTYLRNANSWWRLHAQRLLVDRADRSALPELERMASSDSSAYGRLHALWTLEGMHALNPSLVIKALRDPEPGVRENAIRLAESYLPQAAGAGPAAAGARGTREPSELEKALFALENDDNAKVRFQLLCTLGYLESPEAARIRERILFRDVEDQWVQVAALTVPSLHADILLQTVLGRYAETEGYASLVRRLTATIGAGTEQGKIQELIRVATEGRKQENAPWQSGILAGLAEGLQANKKGPPFLEPARDRLVRTCFDHPSAAVREQSLRLLRIADIDPEAALIKSYLGKAMGKGEDKRLAAGARVEALQFLSLVNPAEYNARLKALIVPGEDPQVQIAALDVLDRIPGDDPARYVLASWERMTPEVRNAALDIFLSENSRVTLLLAAVEEQKISKAAVGWPRTLQLMRNRDESLRNHAQKLLAGDNSKEVNESYSESLKLTGKAADGKLVFQANCAVCHQVRGSLGVAYGPDLGTVHNWLPKDLLANILEPALAIAPGFDLWEVELHSGETVQGLIKSETSAAIELVQAPQVERTINRQDIKSISSTHLSLMPAFGGQIGQQEMADLIAFLRNSYDVQ